MHNIFVTGGFGFIGKFLTTKLVLKKKSVSLTARNKDNISNFKEYSRIFNVDEFNSITRWSEMFLNVDTIIHCAAKAHVKNGNNPKFRDIYNEVNVKAVLNLANQAASTGVKRLIFLSSIGVNGLFTTKSNKFSNSDVPKPIENYAISKWKAEKELHQVSRRTGLEVVIIRAPLVYGEGVKGNFLRLLDLVYKGMPLPFANINNLRSFISLDNLVDFIIYCIDHPKAAGQTFLVSDDEDISTPDLIRKLSRIMGKSSRLFSMPKSIIKLMGYLSGKSVEVDRLLGSLRVDSSHVHKVLKWSPPFSLDEGLEKTVYWYLKNR
jgi:nucleoside-diphosphate-sugar epimerase